MASGAFGLINGVNAVSGWTVNDAINPQTYSASNTRQGTYRGGGIREWNGSFNGLGGIPSVMPNQTFTFAGYTTPTTGVEGTNGITYTGQAICRQVSISWNWNNNSALTWSAQFQGLPGLGIADGAPTLDTSVLDLAISCPTDLKYMDSATETSIPALANATLTISAALSREANSSTRSGGVCYASYSAGTIDWTISAQQEDWKRGVSGYPDLGDDLEFRLYTDATDYWRLKFGKALAYSNLTVDRSSNTTIARQLNIAMQSNNATEVGQIVKPGDTPQTPWWGVAEA